MMNLAEKIELLKEAVTLPFLQTKHIAVIFDCSNSKAYKIKKEIKKLILKDRKEIWNNLYPAEYVEKILKQNSGLNFENIRQRIFELNKIA